MMIDVGFKSKSKDARASRGLKQLKAYLAKIKSFDELKIIQQSRPGITVEGLQDSLLSAIGKDAKGVFDSAPNLFQELGIPNDRVLENLAKNGKLKEFGDFINIIGITI